MHITIHKNKVTKITYTTVQVKGPKCWLFRQKSVMGASDCSVTNNITII